MAEMGAHLALTSRPPLSPEPRARMPEWREFLPTGSLVLSSGADAPAANSSPWSSAAGDRLLPELSADLASFAQREPERCGVEVRLETKIARVVALAVARVVAEVRFR